ncbi:MAG: nitrate reductase cytochrome c-type subunit [Desulfobulbaceae bacterium]|nr:nitrate reductase cytochrome c-type subunit [Desulfobulbaceae bacterium]
MKKTAFTLFLLICAWSFAAPVTGSETYRSLRGETDITAEKSTPPAGMDWQDEKAVIPKTFEQQPPLISHSIKEYEISTSKNDCLDCHDKDSDTSPSPESHYIDWDGKAGEKVSAQWYFCTQCHVGQVDAKPLIENTFQGK